ncbi:MFS transporter [Cupriavidus basilensis]|uniref:MFS transporter n=1 Tax=Cupriavidus basilensis TaxID=68895 RepID=UPI00157A3948|nr:MFS transporter [Cupriavidus basilensis]NUA31301.1 MFS transporter [Cupriavidus basilensis]
MTEAAIGFAGIQARSTTSRGTIVAATLGNVFESFDLYIYGIMAGTIAKLYFPATNDTVSLLLFLGTFGVTFFMRPLGALYLGNLGDRIGRKKVMSLSLLLMTVGMLIIALTPAYASIGVMAPILIVGGRMLQGFSAGGEFGSATALLAEHNPHRRGFIASWQTATQGLAMMMASSFGALLAWSLTPEQFNDWGWRVPFLFGAILGPIGMYIRRATNESAEFSGIQPTKHPMAEMLKYEKTRVLVSAGLIILATITIWMAVFMPTYASKQFHVDSTTAFAGTIATGAVVFLLSPIIGLLSDVIGRTKTMIVSALATFLLAYPAFAVLQQSSTLATLLIVQGVLGLLIALYFAPLPALMADIFPANIRTSGLSLSYNLGVTIFGGFAPFVLTSLGSITGDALSPSYYVMFGAIASGLAIWGARSLFNLR